MGPDLVYAAQYKLFVPVAFWNRVLEEQRTTRKLLRENQAKQQAKIAAKRAQKLNKEPERVRKKLVHKSSSLHKFATRVWTSEPGRSKV